MEEKWEIPTEGSWFLIMVSWEMGADIQAIARFYDVYKYLLMFSPTVEGEVEAEKVKKDDPHDPRFEVAKDSVKALNLIGRRRFVIILKTKSNNVLQKLSKTISLGADINVEIFPATYVTELKEILPPPMEIR